MLEGVRNCISYCNISKYEAIRMGTTIPASLVKGNTSGSLQRTKKANFLVVNANLDLQGVYFQGVKVPSKA
jgi:N-acetylglucosamine-6-phosphate deacetylase